MPQRPPIHQPHRRLPSRHHTGGHDRFYWSQRWREVRRLVLERDHHQCVRIVLDRDGRRVRCGRPATLVHHRVERSQGGIDLDPANLVSLCAACHAAAHPEKGAPQ